MAADVGGLIADIGLNVAGLREDIKQANRELKRGTNRMNRHLGSLHKGVRGLGRSFKGLAAVVSTGLLARYTMQTIDAADQTLKLTQRIGGTTEALSELEFVSERSGVAFNTTAMGLQRMTRRVAEAAEGTGEAKGALRELGLDAERLRQLPLDRTFEEIAEALFQVESEADRVRLAMKLFDSEGVALLQLMTKGARGIRELRREGRELGVTLSIDLAQKAAIAKDELTDLNTAWSALTRNLALKLEVPTALGVLARDIAAINMALSPTLEVDTQAAADRVAKLQAQIDRIREEGKPGASRLIAGLSETLEKANAELDELLLKQGRLNEEAVGALPAAGLGNELALISVEETRRKTDFLADYNDTLATLNERYASAEQQAGALREQLERFGDDLTPEAIRGMKDEMLDIMTSGLEEIDVEALERSTDFTKDITGRGEKLGRSMGMSLQGALSDSFRGIESDWGDLLLRMAADFASSSLLRGLGGAIGGPIGDFFSAIPGFQHGGSFRVGGSGGPDSQLVTFRATPGEDVHITPPGKSTPAGAGTVVFNQTLNATGADPLVRSQLPAWGEQIMEATIARIREMDSNDELFART